MVYKVDKKESLPEGGSTATTPASEIKLTAVQQRHIRRLRQAGALPPVANPLSRGQWLWTIV